MWLKEFAANRTGATFNGSADNTSLRGHGRGKEMRLAHLPGMQGAFLLAQFWYYSVQLQTQVGIGDVIPVCWLARTTALVQMIVGVLFSATLVSLTLDSFRQRRKKVKRAAHSKLMKRFTASHLNRSSLSSGGRVSAPRQQALDDNSDEKDHRKVGGEDQDSIGDSASDLISTNIRLKILSSDSSSSSGDEDKVEESRHSWHPLNQTVITQPAESSDEQHANDDIGQAKRSVGFGTRMCGTRLTNATPVRSIRRFLRGGSCSSP